MKKFKTLIIAFFLMVASLVQTQTHTPKNTIPSQDDDDVHMFI